MLRISDVKLEENEATPHTFLRISGEGIRLILRAIGRDSKGTASSQARLEEARIEVKSIFRYLIWISGYELVHFQVSE